MKIINTVLFFLLLLLTQCTSMYSPQDEISSNSSLSREPGKCYAKALISDEYQVDSIAYIVYTGNLEEEEGNVEIEEMDVLLKPATTKWEKKMTDKNCLSDDPNDCLVWCLVEVPEKRLKYTTLKDTAESKKIELRYYNKHSLVRKGGFTEWREVLCNYQVTSTVITQIQDALSAKGYDLGPPDTIMNTKTKEALNKYQRDNALPVGQLDLETIRALGIDID